MSDLFQASSPPRQSDLVAKHPTRDHHKDDRPLAEQLRPVNLTQVVGQDHILAPDKPLGRQVLSGKLSSTLFWGPPGCGKTTIARLLAQSCQMRFQAISAIFSGVSDLKKAFESAKLARTNGQRTLLFVDEIHRFNRSQQDSFLPVVEDGTVTLVGATTENPSFELNAALLSRMQVLVLNRLGSGAMTLLISRAIAETGSAIAFTDEAMAILMAMADGDGRYLLTMLEQVINAFAEPKSLEQPSARAGDSSGPEARERRYGEGDGDGDGEGEGETNKGQESADDSLDNKTITIDAGTLQALVSQRAAQYDKGQEAHYNLISALHKSLRGSDVDAALYWYARMMAGGEDPRYIGRRLVRFANEDVGMADPQAMVQALSAWQTFERLGSPEGDLALTQAVVYLATAPKSNGLYVAHKAAGKAAKAHGSLSPPKHILNAPTALMKSLGYGDGYAYDHNSEEGFSGQNYFPDHMSRQQFYDPPERGFERDIRKRLSYWQALRDKANGRGDEGQ